MNDDDLTIPLFPTPAPNAPPEAPLPTPVIPSAEGPPTEGPPKTERPSPVPVVLSPSLTPTAADPDEAPLATNPRGPTPEEVLKILDLHTKGYGTRKIASAVGRDRKLVRRLLVESGCDLGEPARAALHEATKGLAPARPSKLDPFHALIREKAALGLTGRRILRELREQGYTGGKTILDAFLRQVRVSPDAPAKKAWRRFETPPGLESQVDWSPYRVMLGGSLRVVHALSILLACSRKAYIRFFLHERLSALVEGLTLGWEDFEGVTSRAVFDRMATVVLGTISKPKTREVVWNPRFLDFARHYAFEPFLCRAADPDRKGEVERFFFFLEEDFVRGTSFESLDDLNRQVRVWLDRVNKRKHGTTGLVPDEAWLAERELLVRLPAERFPIGEQQVRVVGPDCTLTIEGTPYSVPAALAHQTVTVRLLSTTFEVLDKAGRVAFGRPYVAPKDKGKLQLDPRHYDAIPRGGEDGSKGRARRVEEAFVERWPTLCDLVAGIQRRMKSLAHVHFSALVRLADRWGPVAFLAAATRAQAHRSYSSHAVKRLLERDHPAPEPDPVAPLGAAARAALLLDDVDPGSLDTYGHLDDDDDDVTGSPAVVGKV